MDTGEKGKAKDSDETREARDLVRAEFVINVMTRKDTSRLVRRNRVSD